jgi:hypothetical protein
MSTSTANEIISITYSTNVNTTTSTFQQALIEIIQH